MLNTIRSRRGMVTSSHHLASQAGASVLREGGSAIEAGVAMAASLAVVYPHMSGIGGDGFWLIAKPGRAPIAIDASGASGGGVSPERFAKAGLSSIPFRGPDAALTVAGTIAGWQAALRLDDRGADALPLERLLADAIHQAEVGRAITSSEAKTIANKQSELAPVSGFADAFMPGGAAPSEGDILKAPALAHTLRRLVTAGLRDFYDGALARDIAADLAAAGSPVTADDLAAHRAKTAAPLRLPTGHGEIFNLGAPTQGLASLMILGIFERLGVNEANGFDHLHGLVEATKKAFVIRDRDLGDPARSADNLETHLSPAALQSKADAIDPTHAAPWPAPPGDGDTTWFGVIDKDGVAVSLIQSLYFEYGSGVTLPQTGIVWQNRGCAFTLDDATHPRALGPHRKPFHTLNPALARFSDGRTMVYGSQGGDGQPQFQAALYTRYAMFDMGLQEAITAPRWVVGKTWGETTTSLRVESRIDPDVIDTLKSAGHTVEVVAPFSGVMGHAGAVVLRPDGVFEGASDPRSDGAAVGW